MSDLVRTAPAWTHLPLKTLTLPPATTTNAILIGQGSFVVVDPGADASREQARLADLVDARRAAGDRLEAIVLTHHHIDHVSGLKALVKHVGGAVKVMAHEATWSHVKVPRGAQAVTVSDREQLVLDGATVEFIWTPGHASGHVALWDAEAGVLAAGDMVASEGTILVAPPDGDMALYLGSLERLLALPGLARMIPAHGGVIEDPQGTLRHYVAHRLMREAKAFKALRSESRSLLAMLPEVYPEVSPLLYPLAQQSLLAHLIKLEGDGRARRVGSGGGAEWALARGA